MHDNPVARDERTVAVENSSYRLAYLVLSFGLLLSVVVRALVLKEASWDLFVLLMLGHGVATFYQARRRALPRGWAKAAILIALTGAVVGTVVLAVAMMLNR